MLSLPMPSKNLVLTYELLSSWCRLTNFMSLASFITILWFKSLFKPNFDLAGCALVTSIAAASQVSGASTYLEIRLLCFLVSCSSVSAQLCIALSRLIVEVMMNSCKRYLIRIISKEFTVLRSVSINITMGLEEFARKCTPPSLPGNGKQFQHMIPVTHKTFFLPTLTSFFTYCFLSRNVALDFIVRIKDYLLDAVSPATAMEIQIAVKMELENVL